MRFRTGANSIILYTVTQNNIGRSKRIIEILQRAILIEPKEKIRHALHTKTEYVGKTR